MVFNALILFVVTLVAGLLVFVIPKVNETHFKLALVFAGSYLFSITILHIIPELFISEVAASQIGLFLLIGFFLQFFLELFTSGIEHGHMHNLEKKSGHHHHTPGFLLLIGLSIHSIMEGSVLAHPTSLHEHHHASGLLLGILLHKIPAAFALMSVLRHSGSNHKSNLILLVIFSLASPAGVFLGDFFTKANLLSPVWITLVFALVSGNFLKISTTIIFESSIDHNFNLRRTIVSLLGALVAVFIEYVL